MSMNEYTHRKKTVLAGSHSADGSPMDTTTGTSSSSYHLHCMLGQQQQALYWEVSREDQVDQELTGSAQSRKICERWRSPGKMQRWQLLTDKNGVGVWPNASTWMRV